MNTAPYQFITDNLSLAHACDSWKNTLALAIDTEFIRTNTFYPIPALIQIYDGNTCYLVDPLSITDFEPLKFILLSPGITKVFHSCSEDLEVFDRLVNIIPSPLFDTQIVAAFLGYGFSVGYARLLKTLYNIDIPKDETRSDWLQRPLSNAQLDYAAFDVIYLYKLYEKFSKELVNTEKNAWVKTCHYELAEQFYQNQDPLQYFFRIKNNGYLDIPQQKTLFRLSLWRENTARQKNKPRSHILKDEALLELAIKRPTSLDELKKLTHLGNHEKKYHGSELLDLLQKSLTESIEPGWQALPPLLPREAGSLLKQLKSLTEKTAEQWNIAPEMLARKKDFQALARSAIDGNPQLPGSLQGWRQPIIGNQLLEIAQQWHPNLADN